MKIVIHIPARKGSKRVPRKNFRDLCGKPMFEYSLISAINSKITKEIYINTDDSELANHMILKYPDLKYFKREPALSADNSSSDEFNYDFIKKINPDILIMINPVCPLINEKIIKQAYDFFITSDYDTVITASKSHMQFFCDKKPVNININEQLAASQENSPVFELNWAITIWDCKIFKKNMESKGFAVMGDNMGVYAIDKYLGLKVSDECDFLAIEALIKGGFGNRL